MNPGLYLVVKPLQNGPYSQLLEKSKSKHLHKGYYFDQGAPLGLHRQTVR